MARYSLSAKNRRVAGASIIAAVAFVVVATILSLGCATPESKYKTLSFFFDGVPEPPKALTEAEIAAGKTDRAARAKAKPSEHRPWAEDKCDRCHDENRAFQLTRKKEELCLTCHQPSKFVGAIVHGPVSGGHCYGCHDAHESPFPHLLLAEGSAQCDKCHTLQNFSAREQHRQEKGADCLSCHLPHASERRYLLK
jgi:predicted CXXCH cytochrome family protein